LTFLVGKTSSDFFFPSCSSSFSLIFSRVGSRGEVVLAIGRLMCLDASKGVRISFEVRRGAGRELEEKLEELVPLFSDCSSFSFERKVVKLEAESKLKEREREKERERKRGGGRREKKRKRMKPLSAP